MVNIDNTDCINDLRINCEDFLNVYYLPEKLYLENSCRIPLEYFEIEDSEIIKKENKIKQIKKDEENKNYEDGQKNLYLQLKQKYEKTEKK